MAWSAGLPSRATPASGSIPPPSPSPPPVAPESAPSSSPPPVAPESPAPSSSPPPSAPKPESPSPPPSSVAPPSSSSPPPSAPKPESPSPPPSSVAPPSSSSPPPSAPNPASPSPALSPVAPPPSPRTTIPPPTNGGPSPKGSSSSSRSPPPSSVPPLPSPPSTIPPPPSGSPKKKKSKRNFNQTDQKTCWEAADILPDRNPDRWRRDAVGNPVFYPFHGNTGIFAFEYDHIKPYAQSGLSDASNCQILQFNVNRTKGKRIEVPDDFKGTYPPEDQRITRQQMKDASPCTKMNYGEQELDRIEAAGYGSIDRPGRQCKVYKMSQLAYHLGRLKADYKAPKLPNCGPTPAEDK